MKKFSLEVKFTPALEESIKKENIKAKDVLINIFQTGVNLKYKQSMTMDKQRLFSKIFNKLEDAEEVELSEEQFKFLLETFNSDIFPPNRFLPEIVDYLEEIQLLQKDNKE